MAAVTAAVIGATAAVAGTTMSFVQAGEQKKAQRQAERDADEAMQAARKKLEVNFYAQQGIKKEPYELEREALLSQGAQAIQAGVESERGAAATAGRVQLAQQEGQAGIRSAMGQEMTALENKQLGEQSRLRDVGIQLDLGEVSGAQMAAANSAELSAQAMQQGFQGLTSVGQQVAQFVPLFAKQSLPNTAPPTSTPMQQTQPMARPNITMPQAPQYINPNTQPANISPIQSPYNVLPFQGYPPQTPSYLQQQKSFRFYNPSTYSNPFDIYGNR